MNTPGRQVLYRVEVKSASHKWEAQGFPLLTIKEARQKERSKEIRRLGPTRITKCEITESIVT